MRRGTTIVMLAVALSVLPLSSWAGSDPEKAPDTSEFSLAPASRADSTTGDLDGSQTFDRRWDVNYDGTCNATSQDSSYNGQSYQAFAIHSTTTEALIAEVADGGGTLSDSVMFLYCDPFDAANPDQNIVAWDDDGGIGYLSAFTAGDNYVIQADTTYWLVISGYDDNDLGTFTLNLGGDAVFGPASGVPTPTPLAAPGVPATTPWGAAVLLLALCGVALAILRRQA